MKDHITVAICDDEKIVRDNLINILKPYAFQLDGKWELSIQPYDDPQKLLKELGHIDILFLDIEMPKANGFEVAKKIRENGLNTKVIFVTSYHEYIQKAFEVKAFRYLYKPIEEGLILETLKQALKELEEKEVIQFGKEYIRISDIYYMESLGDNIALYTAEEVKEAYGSLGHWEKILQRDFFRCHNSYLINLRFYTTIEGNMAVLKTGTKLPVAVRKKSALKKQYLKYIHREARVI